MTGNYKQDGWIIAPTFEKRDLEEFEETFARLLVMQMKKMRMEVTSDLTKNASLLDSLSTQAMGEVLLMARNTNAGHRLASNQNLVNTSADLLKAGSKELVISGPSFFVNIPSKNSRKYTFHSEQNWYPKRRNFLNVWAPIVLDRIKGDSMEVCNGSHVADWYYFSEYTGYDGKFDRDANVQYEIPDNFLEDFKRETPKVKLGDALFFDGRLVHRSIDNLSDKVYFTIVFRLFDYSQDLTLSSNWADIPYNRASIGYPNINVRP